MCHVTSILSVKSWPFGCVFQNASCKHTHTKESYLVDSMHLICNCCLFVHVHVITAYSGSRGKAAAPGRGEWLP